MARPDKRRRVARRGTSTFSLRQGADGAQVRRFMNNATTRNDHGQEFAVERGEMRLRVGAGLRRNRATGEIEAVPVEQRTFAHVPALRDESGGTVSNNGRVAAVTDIPTAANAIATILDEMEKLRKSLLGE